MKISKIIQSLGNKLPNPKTVVATDKKKQAFFVNPQRDLAKYEKIYRQGGLVSQAVDAYAQFVLSPGYIFTGDEKVAKMIEDWAQDIDLDSLIWLGVVDALVYGDAIQENVFNKVHTDVMYVVPRNPSYFNINFNKWGIITSFTQRVDDNEISLRPEQATHLQLIPLSGENYGLSLLARAYDDIMRDTRTAESTAIAIERHGYPRYHIKAGNLELGTEYQDEDKREIGRQFVELKADNEFVTNPDVEIIPIDVQGVAKVSSYNEWSLSRLLGAMGVPSEVIGTGQSTTTYATAGVEIVSFINKIKTMQRRVARSYNRLIDIKTGVPGIVKLEFNKIDMEGLANTSNSQQKNTQEVI